MTSDDNVVPNGKPEVNGGRGGRPRALDAAAKSFICKLVARGAAIADAAALIDVARSTIGRERRRDPDFHTDLRHAKATARLGPQEVVTEAAKTNWRAAAFLMKHSLLLEQQLERARREAASASRSRGSKLKIVADRPATDCPPSSDCPPRSDCPPTSGENARFEQSPPVFTTPRFSAS